MIDENPPTVSVIMPMLNEERHIAGCLDGVLNQSYPSELVEVLIADGGSTDRSREIVESIANSHPNVKLLNNPGRLAPHALNVCLKHAKNEIVVRLDVHAVYPQDYVSSCVEELSNGRAECVGGTMIPLPGNYTTEAISAAVTSAFGTGGAKYRTSAESQYVDTVWLGAWYRSQLEELGGFNELTPYNEDYELAYRLRKAGGRILLSNKIQGKYHPRPTLGALSRQYFRYGVWKTRMMKIHPRSVRLRQIIPMAFVAALALATALLPLTRFPLYFVCGAYICALATASTLVARKSGWKLLPMLPIVFGVLHLSWGAGALVGMIRWIGAPSAVPSGQQLFLTKP